jgi:hypothetical protein
VAWAYVDDFVRDESPDPVTDDLLYDVLITAFEGGSNHWIRVIDYVEPPGSCFRQKNHPDGEEIQKYASYPLTEGGAVLIWSDDEPHNKRILDREAVRRGVNIMKTKYLRHYTEMVEENFDADTADVLVQCAVLGDIVYG